MDKKPSPRATRMPQGYPKLAQFMSERDHVICKQFRELAILDILYLQAELCDIRNRLHIKAVQDANETDNRKYIDRDWWLLRHSEELGLDGQQYQLALEMRSKLREYCKPADVYLTPSKKGGRVDNENIIHTHVHTYLHKMLALTEYLISITVDTAIQQYQSISSGPAPSEQQRKGLYAYAYYPSTGGYCDFLGQDLGGHSSNPSLLGPDDYQDLLFLGQHQFDDDPVSRLFAGPLLNAFHWVWKHFKKSAVPDVESTAGETRSSLYHYSDEKIALFLGIFGSVLSSVLPTISIIILFFVHDMLARLGLVTLFTFLFSLTMCLATKAKRYEIFAATAAFGSVQVVFIGTTSN